MKEPDEYISIQATVFFPQSTQVHNSKQEDVSGGLADGWDQHTFMHDQFFMKYLECKPLARLLGLLISVIHC